MVGEGSGWKASKPRLPKGQREMFGRAVVAEREPPKKQQCCAGASRSQDIDALEQALMFQSSTVVSSRHAHAL